MFGKMGAGDGVFSGKNKEGHAVQPHPVAGGEMCFQLLRRGVVQHGFRKVGSSVLLGDHRQLVDTADVGPSMK